ncbi:MAG: FKBP-type peptidyl-prolyl cis-trans isomerase [Vicinamibacteraceae bacterium]
MLRRSLLALMLALAVTACGGSDDNPTTPTPQPPQGPATLQIVDVTVGTGAEATGTKLLVLHYTLYAYDPAGPDGRGTRLQGSRDFGRTLDFRQATNAVIPGFEQGVQGMRAGGVRRLTVPPSLAYGSAGNSLVAPNAWIVFEIELISVTD